MTLLTSIIIIIGGAFLTYIASVFISKRKEYLTFVYEFEKVKKIVNKSGIEKTVKKTKLLLLSETIKSLKYNISYHIKYLKSKSDFLKMLETHKENVDILVEAFYIINNKEKIINSMLLEFNDAKKTLKQLSSTHTALVEKYLKTALNDKTYYQKNFIDVISNYIDSLYLESTSFNYEKINYNIKKISDLKKVYSFEVSSVNDLKALINNAENNLKKYEDDLKNVKGSLYFKIYKKIKDNTVSEDNIIAWNNIKKDINLFLKEKLKSTDVIFLSNQLLNILTNLNKLDIQTESVVFVEKTNIVI